MDQVDCVVIGAGVVGLAVARALALSWREVLVLEGANAIGTQTSSRNSEVIHAGIYYPKGSLKALLCVQGKRMLYDYCAERGIGHSRCGKLIVATSVAQVAYLQDIIAKAAANGVNDLVLLNAEQAAPIPLAGLLLNYGVFDHRLDTRTYQDFADGYGLTLAKMRFYWDAYCPDLVARASPVASPMRGNLAVLPPTLLHIAELDVLCAENLAFAEKLRAAGVPLETELFRGTVHGFLRALGRVGAADRAVELAGA
jgi:glycine/D-amino acid oxidase-like deaminating enzyme